MARPTQQYHWLIASVTEHLASENIDQCLLWPHSLYHNGYGKVAFAGKTHRAHRVSYERFVGPFPPDKPNGLHSCDTPRCFNPRHIFAGTDGDNMRDRDSKGRVARGEDITIHALTESEVIEIRALCKPRKHGEFSARGLARRFGVDPATVGRVIRRETWTHI